MYFVYNIRQKNLISAMIMATEIRLNRLINKVAVWKGGIAIANEQRL